MKLYVDLSTMQLIEAVGFRSPVTALRFKRGDAANLEVAFLADGTTHTLLGAAEDLDIHFAVKLSGAYGEGYLVHSTDWTMPDPEAAAPVYECSPSFNTVELDAAMLVGEEGEKSTITLMGEISWTVGGGEPTSTRTFTVIVDNDVVRGSELEPTRAAAGMPTLFLPALRVSPNSNSPYTIGSVGTHNAVVFTMGAGADVVLLTITSSPAGYAAPNITVNPDGDLSTEGTIVKEVAIECCLHRTYVIGGTFANSDDVPIDTSLIPRLVYSGVSGGWHYWTDTGNPDTCVHSVSSDNPGDPNAYWQVSGTDPNAGAWAFSTDGAEWAENLDFTGCGYNSETGRPTCTPHPGTAADLISLVNGEESLEGVVMCAASGLSTGSIFELTATIRNAAQAEYPGQPCVVGDTPGPFDLFLNTTFPAVWTQCLDRRAAAIADSGAVGRAVIASDTKADVFQALGGTMITNTYHVGSGTIPLPEGALAMGFVLIGGGGGGGSGRRGAANSTRCGGGGGAGATVVVVPRTPVGAWSWPLNYTVGAGGPGGAAVTADSTNGDDGSSGGASSFAGFNTSYAIKGNGGSATAGAGGGAGNNSMFLPDVSVTGSAGGSSTTGGGLGNSGAFKATLIPTGGGSGASISSTNANGAGGDGGRLGDVIIYAVMGGGGGVSGAAGGSGNTCPVTAFGSGGGGGGSGGKAGGNGGLYGGGGGGGGASLNGTASGKGGDGAAGVLMVTFYF